MSSNLYETKTDKQDYPRFVPMLVTEFTFIHEVLYKCYQKEIKAFAPEVGRKP
jgi:hypothetical protein